MNVSKPPLCPQFWAGHYDLTLGIGKNILKAAGEPIESMYTWHEKNPTPSFELPLVDSYNLRIDYEESEVVYSFTNSSTDRTVLGFHSGHWALPGLRWCELLKIYHIRESIVGSNKAKIELLLIFPCVWLLESERTEALKVLASSWDQILDIYPEYVDKTVTESALTHNIMWQNEDHLGWITNGKHSPRNPECKMFEYDKGYFDDVRKFVDAIEAF